MARPKGSQDITGWREHGLLRDLALGEEGVEDLAVKYETSVRNVYDFRWRKKHKIAEILVDWSNQFSDLPLVQKHNRLAERQWMADQLKARMDELTEDAETATETMRRVHPEASPVRVPMREWRSLTREYNKLLDQIERETGQDLAQSDVLWGKYTHPQTKLNWVGLGSLPMNSRVGTPEVAGPKPKPKPSAEELERQALEEERAERLREQEDRRQRALERLGEAGRDMSKSHWRTWKTDELELSAEVQAICAANPGLREMLEEESESVPEPEPVQAQEPAPVEAPEPELAPEPEPVDDRGARRLAMLVWGSGSVPRAQFGSGDGLDQAVDAGWLAVAGGLVVRGEVDPRPRVRTLIPV
jgi:hypothetical protein